MADITISTLVKGKTTRYIFGDAKIESAVLEISQFILNYCAIPEVPRALYFTAANMAVDLLLYEQARDTAPVVEIDMEGVGSIQVGDTSVKITSEVSSTERQNTLKGHSIRLDTLLMNYQKQLNLFRRLW